MNSTDIILIGASLRSQAQSAIRDGWRPFCIDMFGDADLRSCLTDVDGSFRLIDRFDQVMQLLFDLPENAPVVISGGFENHSDLLAQLSQTRRIAGPSLQSISCVRDPAMISEVLKETELRTPSLITAHKHAAGGEGNFGPLTAQTQGGDVWLKKRRNSSGGLGVQVVEGQQAASMFSLTDGEYLQAFVSGISMSATFYSRCNTGERITQLLGCALQLSGRSELAVSDFQYCGNVGPIEIEEAIRQRLLQAADALAAAADLNGVFGFDFIANEGGLWVIEVNPRITASHELYEWADPRQPGHVTLQLKASDATAPVRLSSPRSTGTRGPWGRFVVYSQRSSRISEAQHQRMLLRQLDATQAFFASCEAFLADIPPSGSELVAGMPVCSVYFDLTAKSGLALGKLETELSFAGTYSLRSLAEKLLREVREAGLISEIGT